MSTMEQKLPQTLPFQAAIEVLTQAQNEDTLILLSKDNVEEPGLTGDKMGRYALFPIQHPDLFLNYHTQRKRFWTPEELDLSEDKLQFKLMDQDAQHFILTTFAFFANSDNAVLENLLLRLIREITIPEAQMALTFQGAMETMHVETYNLLIDALIEDGAQKLDLFNAVKTNPIVKPKLAWARKATRSTASLAERLVLWCCVEGIFFSSSFCSIFWLRKQKKLPGVCFSNELISEDEYLHVELSAMLYRKCVHKASVARIHEIVREAVALEHTFAEEALPVRLIGMNAPEMKKYICYVADTVLTLLQVPKLYNTSNPFPWMEGLGLVGKANFFEKRVGEYERPDKSRPDLVLNNDELDF